MYKLRELDKKDIESINKWRNDKELIDSLGAPFRYINLIIDERWYENYINNRNNCIRCAIVTDECDDIIGIVSLTSIDYLNQTAELHIMVGEKDNQNKGAGSFAIKEILSHAFLNLNLHRIELLVNSNNEKAIHLYEKIGFIREGVKRNARYKNGRYIDSYLYAILKTEFCN